MERIAGIHAVVTVSTRRVTDSTEVVCMAVQKGRDVTEVYASHMPTNTLIIVAARYIFMTLSYLTCDRENIDFISCFLYNLTRSLTRCVVETTKYREQLTQTFNLYE